MPGSVKIWRSFEVVLSYELSPHPPAFFEAKNILRTADKPHIIQAISDHAENASSEAVNDCIPETDCYVLEGGSLLHRLPFKKVNTYNAITEFYADFTVRHYRQATVVFDGYEDGHSIKDIINQRRGKE